MSQVAVTLHGRDMGTPTFSEVRYLESLVFSRCTWTVGQKGIHSLHFDIASNAEYTLGHVLV